MLNYIEITLFDWYEIIQPCHSLKNKLYTCKLLKR